MAFNPLAPRRHVEGIGANEYEAVASPGIVQGQLLGDRAAMRVAKHGRRLDGEIVEQTCQVRCQQRGRVRRRKSPALPVAAQIRNDQAMPGGETLEHWVEHLRR